MEFDIEPIKLLHQQAETWTRAAVTLLPNLVISVGFLLLVWIIRRILMFAFDRVARRTHMRPALHMALRKIISIAVWTFGLLVAATIAIPSLTPAGLLAGLGLGSLAIGLAFKDMFENLLAGIFILIRKPMRIGDFIKCGEVSGEVADITLRDTYVRRANGVLQLVPNSYIYNNPCDVLTDWDHRRVSVDVGVAYGEVVGEARDVIIAAVQSCSLIQPDKAVQVFAKSFGASSIDFEVTWWTGSKMADERASRDQVVDAIKGALDAAGIEIPFPYRTLTFKEPIRLDRDADAVQPQERHHVANDEHG